MLRSFVFLAALALPAAAQAATITFGPASSTVSGVELTFDNLVAPTTIVGDATIEFTVRADLNSSSEYVDITLDTLSLGRVFDSNSANDPFDFLNDTADQNYTSFTGSATISNADFATLIVDGELDLSFDFSSGVNCCDGYSVEFLAGSISYEVSAVPLPASLPLLGAGIVGLMGLRRRRAAS